MKKNMYSRAVARFMTQFKVNWVIKILIVSDFLIWSAQQLFAPVFALFIAGQIEGGSLETAGIAVAIYFVVRSIVEAPVGIWNDRTKAESDDLYTAFFGTMMTAFVMFGYTAMTQVWELYLGQALLGVGAAIAFPGWYSIFTRHIDKNKEAFEWSLFDTLLGLGMAGSAALGGLLATRYGFNTLFLLAGIGTMLGALLLLSIRHKICQREVCDA
ncbi:MFS transporter [Candidatus Parcubacteria bacterium]|nr:MFS transporter [Candidatus Parcubacteria bacterium]